MPRPVNEPGKGSYWTVDYAASETERRSTRGKTRSSRSDSDPTPYPHHHHNNHHHHHHHYRSHLQVSSASSMSIAAAAAAAGASPSSWMSSANPATDTTRYQRSLSTSDASLYYQPFNYYGYHHQQHQQYMPPAPSQQRPTSAYNFAPTRSYSYQYPNKGSFYGVYNDHQQQSVPYHQADMSTLNHTTTTTTMYQHPLQGMYNNAVATTTTTNTTPTTPTATDPASSMPVISTPPLSDRSSVTTNGVLEYSSANFSSTPSLVTSPHLSVQEPSQPIDCSTTDGSKRTLEDTCSDDLPVTPVPAKRHRRPS